MLYVALALVIAVLTGCRPGISDYDTLIPPTVAYNGVKVYLSNARHPDSGGRGECGWQENANARRWSGIAANGDAGWDFVSTGYRVTVSANSKDNGYLLNRTASNNWGADVHLVTHTNASPSGPCPRSDNYLLVMYRSGNANSTALANKLLANMTPLPGTRNSWDCDTLSECSAAAPYRAYVELFFHTNQSAVTWFQAGYPDADASKRYAWSYRLSVDKQLNYPR